MSQSLTLPHVEYVVVGSACRSSMLMEANRALLLLLLIGSALLPVCVGLLLLLSLSLLFLHDVKTVNGHMTVFCGVGAA